MSQQVDERGIPQKSDYPPGVPIPAFYAGINTVAGSIGLGIGYAVYKLGATAKYDAKIDILSKQDLGWVYLGLIATKITGVVINTNLGIHRKEAKVNVPDQQVYKVHTEGKAAPLGYVLMEQEGVLGAFNRAQRALQNYLEQMPMYLGYFFTAGYVFPFPTFVLSVCWGGSRTANAIGYTLEPKGRMPGTFLSMFVLETLQGLVLLSGIKAVLRK